MVFLFALSLLCGFLSAAKTQPHARSLPYRSTLQPQFAHVHPARIASLMDAALRLVGRGVAHRSPGCLLQRLHAGATTAKDHLGRAA